VRARFIASEGERLDKLVSINSKLSRKRARVVIERGGVRVDGKVQKRASHDVPQGALVEIRGSAPPRKSASAELPERFRDRWLLVVDKPSGLPSQPTRQGHAQHLYGMLQGREEYVGLHHRLDTPASGLLLVTVDRSVNKAVSEAFRSGAIHRRYLAVVVGDPGESGTWDAPIANRPAKTHWRRLGSGDGLSLLECSLETGRTHQIRRHAVGAGAPIAGDRRHGGAAGRLWPRLALHAAGLSLTHPKTGEVVTVESPVPADLAELVARCSDG